MAATQPATVTAESRRTPRARNFERELLDTWAGLRIFTYVWLLLWAPLRPLTHQELTIPFWPRTGDWGPWLERVFIAPWERWDTKYYAWIVDRGYAADDGTAQFHLLFPYLAKPFAWITGNAIAALLIVASLATAALVIVMYRLARLDLDQDRAELSVRLFLAFPVSAVLFFPYTESTFLLATALLLLWSRQGRWIAAGLAGAAACLTRQQGVLLAIPLACEIWEASGRDWRAAIRRPLHWLAVALVPAGAVFWILYRSLAIHRIDADYASVQRFIYSVLISPSAKAVVEVQEVTWPWRALGRAISITRDLPNLGNVLNLACGALVILLTALAWRHLRWSYRFYTLATILLSFAYYTGPEFPYMGLPRHLLLALPVFIGFAPVAAVGRRRYWIAPLFLLSMLFLVMLYVLEAWVP